MFDLRFISFLAITSVVLYGTVHSVKYHTYLDTSNPLLTHLPHPLHADHYFATKSNFLNVYFIKNAWAWTTAAFFFSWLTSPPTIRTKERVFKWVVETAVFVLFTGWFFGPALLERVIASTGGECVLVLPAGGIVSVPQEYCFTKSTVSPSTHPNLFAAPFLLPSADWKAVPRLRRGHDVSGHIFLLTMSVLFLADQLQSSFQVARWSPWHKRAIVANVSLILIWLFASYTTSIFFHSPFEKFTGYGMYTS